MKNFSIILSTIAVIFSAFALVKTTKSPVIEETNSEQQIADALKNNPQMIVDAMNIYREQQIEAQRKAEEENFAKNLDDINSADYAPFVGPKDAKVTVVEFFDFSCGYCRRLAPTMEELIADNADVKFVFKPVSFVAQISAYQAKASLAAYNQGKFTEFYNALFAAEGRLDEAKIDEIASSLGLDMDKYKADVASEETGEKLGKVTQLIQKINVNGVPTVFVNGKHVQAFQKEEFQNAINAAK